MEKRPAHPSASARPLPSLPSGSLALPRSDSLVNAYAMSRQSVLAASAAYVLHIGRYIGFLINLIV